ncbi:hypothetical protein ACFL27_17885, partial [candidate division CSSED10-310 bacterium]
MTLLTLTERKNDRRQPERTITILLQLVSVGQSNVENRNRVVVRVHCLVGLFFQTILDILRWFICFFFSF